MKNFFQLKEKTMELAGVTLQHMEHCPGAVAAFKRNLKDGASASDVAKAAQAVDNYLAIEDKAKKAGKATDADVEEMEKRIDKARTLIDKLGLEGHTYHDMHLDRVEDMVEDDDEELEDDEDEDDDDDYEDEDEDDDEEEEKNMKKEKKTMKESIEDMMPASPDEKSMAMRQAKFIEYVAEEIEEYLEQNRAFPEWMQNKLTALHQKAKDMHAVMAGEYEEDDMEEAKSYGPGHIGAIQKMLDKERETKKKKMNEDITKMSHGRLKFHMNNKSVPHGSYSFDQMKAERDRRLKTGQGAAYKAAKSSMSEKVELDELSPNLLHRYVKKASVDLVGRSVGAAAGDKKSQKKVGQRLTGISGASGRMSDKANQANESYINEKLSVSDGMGAWIDDFKKSDAPQFKGKSEKERRDMAIAAYLSAKRGEKNEKFVSDAQRRAVWATKADGGKGHPDNKGKKK